MRCWRQRAIKQRAVNKTDIGRLNRTRCDIADRFDWSLRLPQTPLFRNLPVEDVLAARRRDTHRTPRLRRLDERDLVAAVWTSDLPHHKVIARIHRAEFDFLVRKNHDDPVSEVDNYLLLGIHTPGRELFELAKIWLPTPGGGIAGVNVNRDQLAVRLHAQDELAFAGAPLLA